MVYAGVVLFNGDKILLQLRDNDSSIMNPNLWGIFGGGIEKGETPEQAAIREIREELELKVKKLDLILKTEFRGEEVYIFRDTIKDISKLKLNEGQEMSLFSMEEILKLKNTVPGLKEMIHKLKN